MAAAEMSQYLGWSPEFTYENFDAATVQYFGRATPHQSAWELISGSYTSGRREVEMGIQGRDAMLWLTQNPDASPEEVEDFMANWRTELEEIQERIPTLHGDDRNLAVRALMATARQIPRMERSITSGAAGSVVAGTLGAMIGALAAGPAGAVKGWGLGRSIGFKATSVYRLSEAYAGGTFNEIMSLQGSNGERVDPRLAIVPAATAGLLAGLSEFATWQMIPGGAEAVQAITGRASTNMFVNQVLTNTVANSIGRYAIGVGAGVVNEVWQETAQVIGVELARGADQAINDGDIDQYTWDQIRPRMLEIIEQSAMSYAVMAMPGTAVNMYRSIQPAQIADRFDTANQTFEETSQRAEQAREAYESNPTEENRANLERVQTELRTAEVTRDVAQQRLSRVDADVREQLRESSERDLLAVREDYSRAVQEFEQQPSPEQFQAIEQIYNRLHRQESQARAAQAREEAMRNSAPENAAAYRMNREQFESQLPSQSPETEYNLDRVTDRAALGRRLESVFPNWEPAQRETALEYVDILARRHGIPTDEYVSTRFTGEAVVSVDQNGMFTGKRGGVTFSADQVTGDIQAIIAATETADFSTWIHELAHIEEKYMSQIDLDTISTWAQSLTNDPDYQRVQSNEWSMARFTSEKFAEAVENFFVTAGQTEQTQLTGVLQRVAQFIQDVYQNVVRKLTQVPQEIQEVIERMVGMEQQQLPAFTEEAGADIRVATEAGMMPTTVAQAIAEGAPGNDAAQAAALELAAELTPENAHAYAQALSLVEDGNAVVEVTEERRAARDEARQMSEAVVKKWQSLDRQIQNVAEENMEAASRVIQAERERWAQWNQHPDLINEARENAGLEPIPQPQTVEEVESGLTVIESMERDLERSKRELDKIADTLPEEFLFQPDGTHPDEISERFPTNMRATEDPYSSILLLNEDTVVAYPEIYEYHANMLKTQYPGFLTRSSRADSIHRDFKSHLKDNLHFIMNTADEAYKQSQRRWYDGANLFSHNLADRYDLTPRQTAGMIAVLSPQKKWQINTSLVERILDVLNDHADHLWDSQMENSAVNILGTQKHKGMLYEHVKGKTLSEVLSDRSYPKWQDAAAYWIRAFDSSYHDPYYADMRPTGEVLNMSTDRIMWSAYPTIGKAIDIALNDDYQLISRNMGEQNKVRNFYNNILSPNSPLPHVTVDTHAVAAGLFRALGGSTPEVMQNFGSSIKGMPHLNAKNIADVGSNGLYYIHADAIREVAQELGYRPLEIQSITWEYTRALFDSAKDSKPVVDSINRMWAERTSRSDLNGIRREIILRAEEANRRSKAGLVGFDDSGTRSTTYDRRVPEHIGRRGRDRSGADGGVSRHSVRSRSLGRNREGTDIQRTPSERATGSDVETLFQPSSRIVASLTERFPGINVRTSRPNANTLTIDMLKVPEGMREQGVASEVMNELTRWADQHNQTLALTPTSEFGATKSRLKNFYKRYGFTDNTGRSRNLEISESMIREPSGDTLFQADTSTPQFKSWFADSKVVDEQGEPLTVYHGSPEAGFTEFNTIGSGDATRTGAWFTNNSSVAKTYSGTDTKIMPTSFDEAVENMESIDTIDGKAWRSDIQNENGALFGLIEPNNYYGWDAFYEQSPIGHFATREEALEAIRKKYDQAEEPMGPSRPGVYGVYLSIKKPAILDAGGRNWQEVAFWNDDIGYSVDGNEMQRMLDQADEYFPDGDPEFYSMSTNEFVQSIREIYDKDTSANKEYSDDGVIIRNVMDPGGKAGGGTTVSDIYIAFEPTQIKSVHNTGEFDINNPDILFQEAYHGTPYVFEPQEGFPYGRFELDRIGTGEGAQAYGWGIYFAESEDVSQSYMPRDHAYEETLMDLYNQASDRGDYASMEVLEKAMLHQTPSQILETIQWDAYEQDSQIRMRETVEELRELYKNQASSIYKLDIPDSATSRFLDYDKPLSQQPRAVQQALASYDPDSYSVDGADYDANERGSSIYARMVNKTSTGWSSSDRAGSLELASIGIPGMQYLDQDSRTSESGTHNYVVWDQGVLDEIALLERNDAAISETYEEVLFQEMIRDRTWQLRSEAIIAAKMRGRMPGRQILATIQKNGVKAEELVWLGLDSFLDTDEVLTPEQVMNYIQTNRITVEPAHVIEPQTGRFRSYVTEGPHKSYEEHFLKLPIFEESAVYRTEEGYLASSIIDDEDPSWRTFPENTTRFESYSSPHWPGDGTIVAHARTTEREAGVTIPKEQLTQYRNIATGLFIEAQTEAKRRKKLMPTVPVEDQDILASHTWDTFEGAVNFRTDSGDWIGNKAISPEAVANKIVEVKEDLDRFTSLLANNDPSLDQPHFGDMTPRQTYGAYIAGWQEGLEVLENIQREASKVLPEAGYTGKVFYIEEIQSDWHQAGRDEGYRGEYREGVEGQIAQAPFRKTWHELVFRTMLREAAERGYEKIVWTYGIEQDFRYETAEIGRDIHADAWSFRDSRDTWKDGDFYWESLDQETVALLYKLDGEIKEIETEFTSLPKFLPQEMVDQILQQRDDRIENPVFAEDLNEYYEGMNGASQVMGTPGEATGTKGHSTFYDQMLVSYANKLGKKFGVQVEDLIINIASEDHFDTRAEFDARRKHHSLSITPEMRDSLHSFETLFQEGQDESHMAQVRAAVEAGQFVPVDVLNDYQQEPWAREELQIQKELRVEALQSDSLEDFIDFNMAMQTNPKEAAYYAEVFEESHKHGLDRGEENTRFLNSLSNKRALQGLLGEIMLEAAGDLDGMHVSIVTAAKASLSGKEISDAHYNSVMAQIRDNPASYRRQFAEILGDREAIQQLNDEIMHDPKEAEIERLRESNRQMRQQNSVLGKNLKQQEHRTEMLERYAKDIEMRVREQEQQIKSQIQDIEASQAEEQNYVKWLERSENRNEQLMEETQQRISQNKAKIAELRDTIKSAREEAKRQTRIAVKDYRQARESRDYVKKLIKNIMAKPSISIDHAYAEQIRELQSPLHTTTPNHIRTLRKKLPEIMQDSELTPEAKQQMQQMLDHYSLKDWSVEELEALADRIQELRHRGRETRWNTIQEELMLVKQARQEVIDSANPDYEGAPFNLGTPDVESSRQSGALTIERLSTLTSARVAEMLDRYAKNGAVYHWLVREVEDATASRLRETSRRIEAGSAKMKELGITPADMLRSRTVNGVRFEVQQIMGLYLYSQNDKAMARLVNGNNIAPATIEAAINSLSESEQQFADWMIESFEQEYGRLAQAFIEDQNAPLGKEERYFPMMVRDVSYDAMPEQIANDILARGGVVKQYIDRGMTKDRIDISPENQPSMRLDAFAIWSQMSNMQENYINSAKLIKRLHKIFGDREVQHAMIDARGMAVNQWTRDYINKIAKPNAVLKSFTALENMSRQMRSNVAVAALSFNPLTVLKQFPSIALAMGRVSPLRIAESVGHMIVSPEAFIEQIHEMDPYMAAMKMDPILEEMRLHNKTGYERLVNKIGRTGMWGIGLMDKTVKSIIWRASYEQSIAQGMPDADAIHEARRTVIETQPGGLIQDLPNIATMNEGFRWLTMFSSQLQKIYGIATHDIPTAARRGEIGKAIMMSTGFVVSSLGIGMINLRRAPEDPEEAAGLVGDAMINMVPVLGPAIISATNNYPTRNPAPIDAVGQVARSIAMIGGDNDEAQFRQSMRAVESVLFAAGAPTVQGKRMLRMFETGDPWEFIGGPPRERR
ncbi:MAG: hypothetical protein LAT56_00285 [Wenzhouxiangella sp.]|nr:hypothetical protein [Wenzhouxiangella sp.]